MGCVLQTTDSTTKPNFVTRTLKSGNPPYFVMFEFGWTICFDANQNHSAFRFFDSQEQIPPCGMILLQVDPKNWSSEQATHIEKFKIIVENHSRCQLFLGSGFRLEAKTNFPLWQPQHLLFLQKQVDAGNTNSTTRDQRQTRKLESLHNPKRQFFFGNILRLKILSKEEKMTDRRNEQRFACHFLRMTQLLVLLSAVCLWNADGFVPSSLSANRSPSSAFGLERKQKRVSPSFLYEDSFQDNDEEEDDDDDDEYIDTDSLGDWRNFRRSLAMGDADDNNESSKDSTASSMVSNEREVTENEQVLKEQNKELAEEYASGIWAHQVATVSAEKTAGPF